MSHKTRTAGAVHGKLLRYYRIPRGIAKRMIPVQVGTRIVDLVDPRRAASMASGENVRVVRDRRSKSIVRLILQPMSDGRNQEASVGGNSCRAHKVEYLFQDGVEPSELNSVGGPAPRCSTTIFALKPSFLFERSSSKSQKSMTSGRASDGLRAVPTTSAQKPVRSGTK